MPVRSFAPLYCDIDVPLSGKKLCLCKCVLICPILNLDEAFNSQVPVRSKLKKATLIYPQNGYCQAIIALTIISNTLALNQLGSRKPVSYSVAKAVDQMPYSLSKITRLAMLQFPCPHEIWILCICNCLNTSQ